MRVETIIALSTPHGKSAIAVVRVSGPAVLDICKKVLPSFDMKPRVASLVKCSIDTLLAIYFPAPNSYTGEDVLELFPHGNPFIVRKLIEEICKIEGVRLANKGEFTERAFLSGKIDLVQAEALSDLLSATNSQMLANAQKLLTGEISTEIKDLAEKIKQISAELELDVDFAEDVECRGNPPLLPSMDNVLQNLQKLKKRFKLAQTDLPRVVVFGAPNAGKSTLINKLVSADRLLVSEIPGTTRDFVEVPLHLPGGDILLVDTAGLASKAQNEIDRQAMQKTMDILEKANLKVLAIDVSVPLPPEYDEWEKIADLVVETHVDLINAKSNASVESGEWRVESDKSKNNVFLRKSDACTHNNSQLSTLNSQLIKKLNAIFFPETETEETWITSERQIACIKKAEECVKRALEANAVELAAFEMREAREALRSITGEISDESVLDAIFGSYCIGK